MADTITLHVFRYNPETDKEPYYQDFTVSVKPTDRILDALMDVKTYQDGTLAVRRSCAHGVCGSDAMIINGIERLACKTLVKDVVSDKERTVTIEPLRALPVQRDLMVDQTEFFNRFRSIKPYLINRDSPPAGEWIQSSEERDRFEDPTKCILCGSCYSSCPEVNSSNPEFIGPQAVIQAARFNFDSRDQGSEERMAVLDRENGAWGCQNHFNCTKVCPREIKVTKMINQTKQWIKKTKNQ
jgi:succinate dehydrogenase / fumarate reductase iron-sulfur subunit